MATMDVLERLATCLCAQIEADGSPPTCFCGVVPGEAAASLYGGNCRNACGMAWVRLSLLYPSSAVGEQNTEIGNCSGGLGADIEIGIMRCVKIGDNFGNAPTDDELLGASTQQAIDAMTLFRTVFCCDAIDSKDVIVGSYTPIGPAGGLVGGSLSMSVAIE